jgi:hypothetical protein
MLRNVATQSRLHNGFESELEIYAAIIDAASATEGLVSALAIHGNRRRALR